MAKYAIESTTLTGIADAIREKTKTTESVQTSQMAEAILAIKGGGVELDVVTASSLPAEVTDGQIVVITDTTPGTVYIDTDEPASPANGDVWVRMEAEATVRLELSDATRILRSGITSAAQWDGSTWWHCNGYLGASGAWQQFSAKLPPIGTALNDFTWEQIAIISASGKASDYFAVGDAKEITINGRVGNTTFSNLSIWAFIIGIYHNPEREGGKYIHFQIGKSAQNGTNLCLCDAFCDSSVSDSGYFTMNHTGNNAGGWGGSPMRVLLNGNNSSPATPESGTMLATLPSDLRSVMKGAEKYTDNVGGGNNTASNVTAKTDYLWLLSEYELFGTRTNANSAEQNFQKQYDYYASGNSKFFYRYNSQNAATSWWLRSPGVGSGAYFCRINSSGVSNAYYSNYSRGVAPAFCV